MSWLRRISALLLLSPLWGCQGEAPSTELIIGADYSLHLTPVFPLNQAPLDGSEVWTLELSESGEVVEHSLTLSGEEGALEGLSELEEAYLTLLASRGGEAVALGRSGPISISEGEEERSIFVAEPDQVAWLEVLEDESVLGALASDQAGSFFLFGGSNKNYMQQDSGTQEGIWRLGLDPSDTELQFQLLEAEMPSYTPEGGSESFQGRVGHSATWVPDSGQFLVAGGTSGWLVSSNTTGSAFLFDPQTESVSESLDLEEARWGHQAIPTSQGDVLLVGGFAPADSGYISDQPSIELYRPGEGFETLVDDLQQTNTFHVFGDGASMGSAGSLTCGGFQLDASSSWRAATRCHLISNALTVEQVEDLPRSLSHFQLSSLPDGRVLLSGGLLSESGGEPSWESQSSLLEASSELYVFDPSTRSWSQLDLQLSIPRHRHVAAALADGRVMIAGGATLGALFDPGDHQGLACAELLDLELGTSTPLSSCSEDSDTAELPDRMTSPSWAQDPWRGILMLGGSSGSNAVRSTALFVPR